MHFKKLILTACAVMLLFTGLHAQRSPWSIAASVGASFPTGKFAGKDFSDSSQSLATMGLAVDLLCDYRINAHFGLALLLTGQDNSVNTLSIEKQMAARNLDATAIDVNSGDWMIGKVMLGPTLSLPFGKTGKWQFTARLMAGAMRTSEPKLLVQEVSELSGGFGLSGPVTEESQSYRGKVSLPWAFAYLGGVAARYAINERWSFRVDLDYSGASVRVPDNGDRPKGSSGPSLPILTTGPPSLPPPYVRHDHLLSIASLHFSMGMEFRL